MRDRLGPGAILGKEVGKRIHVAAECGSADAQAKEKPGRTPLKDIKLMKDDAAAVEKQSEEIKARYTKIFRV